MKIEFASLYELFSAIPDERAAINYFRSIRWASGEHCPYCGTTKVYEFAKSNTFKCADCRKRFSLRVGTIFEGTKIEIRKWLAAIWLITNNSKGIASTQLAKDIGVTQKTAWFMLHRLRHAARTRSFNRRLKGEIEADETLIGGKEKNKHADKRSGTGKWRNAKVVVGGMLERGGEMRAWKMDTYTAAEADAKLAQHVEPGATLITDEWKGYMHAKKNYVHEKVNHTSGEYVRYEGGKVIHTNSIESFWSLFKRQVYGIHHQISPKHLHRYVEEAVWRFNLRAMTTNERLKAFLGRIDGRLKYTMLIAKA
jgi:transposase-like protein